VLIPESIQRPSPWFLLSDPAGFLQGCFSGNAGKVLVLIMFTFQVSENSEQKCWGSCSQQWREAQPPRKPEIFCFPTKRPKSSLEPQILAKFFLHPVHVLIFSSTLSFLKKLTFSY
jgi:hypothetical protein